MYIQNLYRTMPCDSCDRIFHEGPHWRFHAFFVVVFLGKEIYPPDPRWNVKEVRLGSCIRLVTDARWFCNLCILCPQFLNLGLKAVFVAELSNVIDDWSACVHWLQRCCRSKNSLQVTKGVGIEQIYPSVGASIKASGLWILNVAQDVFQLMFTFVLLSSYSRNFGMLFILASFVSSSVGEMLMQAWALQLVMGWIHTTDFLLFPH